MGQFAKQQIRYHTGEDQIERAANISDLDFKTQVKDAFRKGHYRADLRLLQPFAHSELKRQRHLPCGLQFATKHLNNAFDELLLDFGEIANLTNPLPRASQKQVDHWENQREVDLDRA